MKYDYNFVVKKTAHSEWTIFTDKGIHMHTLLRCISKEEAENRAKAWGSSWPSVCIRIEDEQT